MMNEKLYKASDLIGILLEELPDDVYLNVLQRLAVTPSAVVHCEGCKHWHEDVANNFTSIPRGGCKLVRGITNGEFFCALGERKEINSR